MNKKQLLKRLLLVPVDFITLLPFVVGASMGLCAWGFDSKSGLLWFSSWALMLLSVFGIYLPRLALGWGKNVEKVIAAAQAEEDNKRKQQLDDLFERLRGDGDKRTDDLLEDLRTVTGNIAKELKQATGWVQSMESNFRDSVEKLFRACVTYLEKSLELYQTAQTIKTRSIKLQALDQRKKLLEDVETSLNQLGGMLDWVRKMNLNSGSTTETEGHVAEHQRELNMLMESARKVEERAQSWDTGVSAADKAQYLKAAEAEGKK